LAVGGRRVSSHSDKRDAADRCAADARSVGLVDQPIAGGAAHVLIGQRSSSTPMTAPRSNASATIAGVLWASAVSAPVVTVTSRLRARIESLGLDGGTHYKAREDATAGDSDWSSMMV
jgi:hypothetical protein